MKKIIALWQHRYRKINYFLCSYFYFFKTYLQLKLQKTKTSKQNIAIVLTEQFGDIVACEPVSRYVREQFPSDNIIWIVRKPFAEIVKFNPHLDGFHIEYSVLETILLLENQAFDKVFNLHISNRFTEYTRQVQKNLLADKLNITVYTYFFHGCILEVFSEIAGLPRLNLAPQLYLPPIIQNRINELQLPLQFVVIHAQSNLPSKNWNTSHWHQLVNNILDNSAYVVIEIGLNPEIETVNARILNLCGKLSLLETAEVIRRSKLFIGIDSGPAHFANALGIYGIILLGKLADFDNYMPYSGLYQTGEKVTIVRQQGKPCSQLPYEPVWNAVKERLI